MRNSRFVGLKLPASFAERLAFDAHARDQESDLCPMLFLGEDLDDGFREVTAQEMADDADSLCPFVDGGWCDKAIEDERDAQDAAREMGCRARAVRGIGR